MTLTKIVEQLTKPKAMENILREMNKAFDSRVRIGIMAVLLKQGQVDFKYLKQLLGTTDGNLASHTAALERKGFIKVDKKFIAKRPNTSYHLTPSGKKAFRQHINALKKLLEWK